MPKSTKKEFWPWRCLKCFYGGIDRESEQLHKCPTSVRQKKMLKSTPQQSMENWVKARCYISQPGRVCNHCKEDTEWLKVFILKREQEVRTEVVNEIAFKIRRFMVK